MKKENLQLKKMKKSNYLEPNFGLFLLNFLEKLVYNLNHLI